MIGTCKSGTTARTGVQLLLVGTRTQLEPLDAGEPPNSECVQFDELIVGTLPRDESMVAEIHVSSGRRHPYQAFVCRCSRISATLRAARRQCLTARSSSANALPRTMTDVLKIQPVRPSVAVLPLLLAFLPS
jgi:hypothetical protein